MNYTIKQPQKPMYYVHPKKFAMWVACGSIVMLFVSLTSAYLVRKAAGNWTNFQFPNFFYFNIAVVLLSSVSLFLGAKSFKEGNNKLGQVYVTVSALLGILFLYWQYCGWQYLKSIGVYMNGNPSGSFMFAITGMHAFHLLGGLVALLVLVMYSFSMKQKISEKQLLNMELMSIYWHFVGALWIYLVIFFNF